jgi:hypothetical protein
MNDLMHLRLRAVDKFNEVCMVCSESHDIGNVVTILPCGHMFHSTCICDWLNRNCTCPTCRYELPTDDAKYEVGRRERMRQRQRTNKYKSSNSTNSGTSSSSTTSRSSGAEEEEEEDVLASKREAMFQKRNKMHMVARALQFYNQTGDLLDDDNFDDDEDTMKSIRELEILSSTEGENRSHGGSCCCYCCSSSSGNLCDHD